MIVTPISQVIAEEWRTNFHEMIPGCITWLEDIGKGDASVRICITKDKMNLSFETWQELTAFAAGVVINK